MSQPTPALTPLGGGAGWAIGLGVFAAILVLGPCCLLGAVGGLVARTDPSAGAALGGGGFASSLLFGVLLFAVFAFMAWRRSNLEGVAHLHALQQAWGGEVYKPGWLKPMVQPCWIGVVEGAPVRVSLYRVQRGRSGAGSLAHFAAISAMNASQSWQLPVGSHVRLSIRVATPAGLRLVGVCRNIIAAATAELASMQHVMTGDPSIDRDFMFFCDDVALGGALVAREQARLSKLLGFNAPWISRLELSKDGAEWGGPYSERTDLQAIQGIIGELRALGQ